MKWEILYCSKTVQQDLLNLPAGIQARYIHLTDRMEVYGPNLGLTHTKAIEHGLFELRLKSKEGIGRVFYCTLVANKIVMLHTFIKKSQKIPASELKVALQRLKEVKENAES